MLQAAYARKPDGLSLNFAIDKVWGQGEEGPPGSKLRFHRDKIVPSFHQVVSYGTIFYSGRSPTIKSKHSAKYFIAKQSVASGWILGSTETKPKYKPDLPCTRKTLQQCRSTSKKSATCMHNTHSMPFKCIFIGMIDRAS